MTVWSLLSKVMTHIKFCLIVQWIKIIVISILSDSLRCELSCMLFLFTCWLSCFMSQQLIVVWLNISKIKCTVCSFVAKIRTTITVTMEKTSVPESWLYSLLLNFFSEQSFVDNYDLNFWLWYLFNFLLFA